MTTSRHPSYKKLSGFTLVEIIVVMAVITILISVGAVGIGRMDESQKTNTSIALVEALTNEAQRMAIGQNTKTRLCIFNDADNLDRHLRYFAIAVQDPDTEIWNINSRGSSIPKGVYFHPDLQAANTDIGTYGTGAGINFPGDDPDDYYFIEFNSQGICINGNGLNAGASIILVGGYLNGGNVQVKGNDKVGFVIWRNGSTSKIRSVDQIQ